MWSEGHDRVVAKLKRLEWGGALRLAREWGVNPGRISEVASGTVPTRTMLFKFHTHWKIPLAAWERRGKNPP